jgi:hypothetical protein
MSRHSAIRVHHPPQLNKRPHDGDIYVDGSVGAQDASSRLVELRR